jgi:Ca2+:H+ antiporter
MGTSSDQDKDQFRSQAKRHASQRSVPTASTPDPNLLAPSSKATKSHQAGGLSNHRGRDRAPDATRNGLSTTDGAHSTGNHSEKSTPLDIENVPSNSTSPPPAPPPVKSEDARSGDSTIEPNDEAKQKHPMTIARMKAGSVRFVGHFKRAIFHSWINVLLLAVPAGIAAEAAHLQPAVIFAINAVAIVPLAGLLSQATESVAARLGDTWGALLNVSFGNAVELIIFIIALVKNEIRIVQASLLGSILANLLLILGMAFLAGGLRYREQIYNSTVTQMSACLLSLSVMSLLLPVSVTLSF